MSRIVPSVFLEVSENFRDHIQNTGQEQVCNISIECPLDDGDEDTWTEDDREFLVISYGDLSFMLAIPLKDIEDAIPVLKGQRQKMLKDRELKKAEE
jgi:hypothetical protein